MGIVYLLDKVFIILEIKVALISYSLSKAASKAAENIGLIAADKPHAGRTRARVEYGQTDDGFHCKQKLLRVVRLTGCSAYDLNGEKVSWKHNHSHWSYDMPVMSNEHQDILYISIHLPLNCSFHSLFMQTSMEISRLCITGPLWRESTSDQWILLTPSLTKSLQSRKHF